MTTDYDTIIVGGGVGGLVTAIRLATAGQNVALFERNDQLGGKLAVRERDGFTFDIGPSLLTLPELFDDVFRLAGTSLEEEIDLVRLDPSFRYFWPDASTLATHDDPMLTASSFDGLVPGAGDEYLRLLARARRTWAVAERTFLAGPMSGPVSLARRLGSPRDLVDVDAARTLARLSDASFRDPRMRQWFGRYATYSGSDPSLVPAKLGCIAAVESDFGCWYVRGGLGSLRDALVRTAVRLGVEVRTGCEVLGITASRRRVTGVRTADSQVAAPVVIANADAEHVYSDLLPQARRLARVRRTERSTSGIALLVGVEGRTPLIAHHNVWFSRDYAQEFADIRSGKVPSDPTIYACVSSVTDETQAPSGCENWFILINTPADERIASRDLGPWLLERLSAVGPELRSRAKFAEVIGPHDIAQRYRSPGGAIYGTSSNGRRAAFRRPSTIGARRGLYLVGGSSHPGGGLPLVTMSARIVADLILRRAPQR